jgi:uncharacterized protein (TIGR00730 family)
MVVGSAVVSVFGGSLPKPGSAAYQEAHTLGRLLALAGYAVATGGYSGTMEAVSRGAAEAGAHVIGVTTNRFDNWGRSGEGPNQWVKEEIKFSTLRERLYHLVSFCDAAVALRGGIGTLSEVSLMWSLLQTGEIEPKPLVLLGKEWQDWLTRFYGGGEYIRPEHMKLWECVRTPEDVIIVLQGRIGS